MSDNLKKFMEEVSKDRDLMEKAKNAFCICAIAGGGATDGKECVGNWKG